MRLIAFLQRFQLTRANKETNPQNDNPLMEKSTENILEVQRQAENVILKSVQEETFSPEMECIENKQKLKKISTLSKLSPVFDTQGLLRVGGDIANTSTRKSNTKVDTSRKGL